LKVFTFYIAERKFITTLDYKYQFETKLRFAVLVPRRLKVRCMMPIPPQQAQVKVAALTEVKR